MKTFCRECECLAVFDHSGAKEPMNQIKWYECHRRSPVWGGDGTGGWSEREWPRVRDNDWCFEGVPVQHSAPVSDDE